MPSELIPAFWANPSRTLEGNSRKSSEIALSEAKNSGIALEFLPKIVFFQPYRPLL